MKFSQLLEIVGERPLFEPSLLLAGDVDPVDLASQLSRWVSTGRLVSLRRGLYVVADPYASRRPHPFEIANALVGPSYVSMEYALGWYGITPESVYTVTSVTTGRTGVHDTPYGRFAYRHVRPPYLWGYELLPLSSGPVALQAQAFVATPEKALLDLLYFRTNADDRALLQELRLETEGRLDAGKLSDMARRAASPRLIRAASIVAEIASLKRDEYRELEEGEQP
jgi:predicted transcriptional regulator of viral defense system